MINTENKSCHDVNFVFTENTAGCHNDNLCATSNNEVGII